MVNVLAFRLSWDLARASTPAQSSDTRLNSVKQLNVICHMYSQLKNHVKEQGHIRNRLKARTISMWGTTVSTIHSETSKSLMLILRMNGLPERNSLINMIIMITIPINGNIYASTMPDISTNWFRQDQFFATRGTRPEPLDLVTLHCSVPTDSVQVNCALTTKVTSCLTLHSVNLH